MSGTAGIELFQSLDIPAQVAEKSKLIQTELQNMIENLDPRMELRGLGMIWGVDLSPLKNEKLIDQVTANCFEKGLIIENAGRKGQVLKLLPPLTITQDELLTGLHIIERSIKKAL